MLETVVGLVFPPSGGKVGEWNNGSGTPRRRAKRDTQISGKRTGCPVNFMAPGGHGSLLRTRGNMAREKLEMSDNQSEKSEMSTVEFGQKALRTRVAPPSLGSVKRRIGIAARELGWSYNRTRDIWYGDERVSMKPKELFRLEAVSGLYYARQEVREHDAAIERATAILGGENTHLIREVVAAVLTALGVPDRPGA